MIEADKTLVAVEFDCSESKGQLHRSRRALKEWRKESPPASCVPLPLLIAHGMAMILIKRQLGGR